jgi:dGTPase
MNFETIYTSKRVGEESMKPGSRSGFQRDFDRLIFSSAFRRLQNKTQVFPLPGTAFVHNRLTHSLEVASVGRSLGKMVGEEIARSYKATNEETYEFYKYELSNVIAAGCLAHDIGNPAFGHSGEKAISAYFIERSNEQIGSTALRSFFTDAEWADLSNFEGNANAVRVLAHSFKGRFRGGFGLTYTTIASILKYPCESSAIDKKFKHRKKYGFFQSEKAIVATLASELNMVGESTDPLIWKRHPFVYLVEAADDICYRIVDMEDAHRLGILSTDEVSESFFSMISSINRPEDNTEKIRKSFDGITDRNEKISYLRARAINTLTLEAAAVFMSHKDRILEGAFNNTLLDHIEDRCSALGQIMHMSVNRIYSHPSVMQIELAGYNVMSELLQLFVPALLKEKPSHKDEKILALFPFQFQQFKDTTSQYLKVMSALDFLSGMTDTYATEVYRRLKGITIPQHGS